MNRKRRTPSDQELLARLRAADPNWHTRPQAERELLVAQAGATGAYLTAGHGQVGGHYGLVQRAVIRDDGSPDYIWVEPDEMPPPIAIEQKRAATQANIDSWWYGEALDEDRRRQLQRDAEARVRADAQWHEDVLAGRQLDGAERARARALRRTAGEPVDEPVDEVSPPVVLTRVMFKWINSYLYRRQFDHTSEGSAMVVLSIDGNESQRAFMAPAAAAGLVERLLADDWTMLEPGEIEPVPPVREKADKRRVMRALTEFEARQAAEQAELRALRRELERTR